MIELKKTEIDILKRINCISRKLANNLMEKVKVKQKQLKHLLKKKNNNRKQNLKKMMTLLAQILDKIDIYILHILKIINEQIIGRITHFLINLKKRYQNLMNFVGYINNL